MKASDYIARSLAEHGVTHVFELVGGMITHLLDSLASQPGIRIVSMAHEQGAAFAAEGFARVSGRPMVAMATSGPGATNLLTGIGSCYFDSVPAVFITGQVNRHEMKGSRGVRQLGFQETDIVAMAAPITKAAWLVQDPSHLPRMLADAFRIACEGRPGPVLLDVPMDVQRADIPGGSSTAVAPERHPSTVTDDAVRTAWAMLAAAERPLVLAGGGLRSAGCRASFRRVARRAGIPIVNSLMAVDALPAGDPLRVGLIGSYGNRWANMALGEADAVLVLGSRLDIRQTGADVDGFRRGKMIIHVDCDPSEVNNRVQGCMPILASLPEFLAASGRVIEGPLAGPATSAWRRRIAEHHARHSDLAELSGVPGINPNEFMHLLSARASGFAGYVVDVGQHQMWAAQSIDVGEDQFFITSGGMGAMGFALPAAIGAALASDAPVVVIAGDGSMQLNVQELQTVVRNRLPLKMVVINNQAHGMVRQFQESYFGSRYQSTVIGYSSPDFRAIAQAYGIPAERASGREEAAAALDWLMRDPSSPAMLEVMVPTGTNVYPKIAFGRPITEMEPLARPVDMEGT